MPSEIGQEDNTNHGFNSEHSTTLPLPPSMPSETGEVSVIVSRPETARYNDVSYFGEFF